MCIPSVRRLPLLLCLCGSAAAAIATESNRTPEEILVTAHRLPATPVPRVDVIEREEMIRRDQSVGPDILAGLPGIAISRSGAFGGQAQIRVRGAEANHLQVLVDGIEVNDPAIGSEFDFAHLNLAGVERIEFLPGAQSALWGSDAVAGVLNLVTTPRERRRELAVSGGSFDTHQARFNLSDSGASGYYVFAGDLLETDGTNHAVHGTEQDGYDNRTLHFHGGLNREKLGARLVLRHTDSGTDTDPAPFPVSVPIDGNDRTELKQTAARLELNAAGADERWSTALSLSFLDTANDAKEDGLLTNQVDGERLRLTLRQHVRLTGNQGLTAILEREEESFRQQGAVSFFGDPNQHQKGRTDSLALEHLGRWDRLSTALSARFDRNDDFADVVSFRLSARYRITDVLQSIVAFGTGVKNPTFYERYGFLPASFTGNPDLEPEENRHLSLTLRYEREALLLQATAFRDELRDEIDGFVASATPGLFTAVNLEDDSRRQGLELQADTQLAGIELSASYTYLNAQDPAGAAELRRPKHTGHLRLGRGFAGERGYAQIGGAFTGRQRDTDFRTFQTVTLDAYSKIYATATLRLRPGLTLGARIENALDENTSDIFMYRAPGRAAYLSLTTRW